MKSAHRIAFALATVFSISSASMAQSAFDHLVGKPAPKFALKTVDGKSLTNASLKGKVVLIDMWATWCGPCKAASPTMQALHKKYAAKGLVVIGANVFENPDPLISKKASIAYAKEHKYTYTFTYGSDSFAKLLGVKGIPFFLLIDDKGIVKMVETGFSEQISPKKIGDKVAAAIAAKKS